MNPGRTRGEPKPNLKKVAAEVLDAVDASTCRHFLPTACDEG